MKQADIYTEALVCLRSILQADHPEFQNWIDWLERDIQDWTQRREVAHHLLAYGGISVYTTPESLWGYDHISSAYSADPAESKTLIYEQVRRNFPEAMQEELDAVLGWTR